METTTEKIDLKNCDTLADVLYTTFVEINPFKDSDHPFTSVAMADLYKGAPVALEDLRSFINDNLFDLRRACTRGNTFIARSIWFPIVAYYVANRPDYLRKYWPLDHESCVKSFNEMGYSWGAY